MQDAETVLAVLRERGRKGLPCDELYRQMFNSQLYLLAYGRIYANEGAMTPGASAETADGMSEAKIEEITEAMRRERYRFSPARRVFIPKKNGKMRPLGLPSWSDKLVGEVVRLLLEAYYEPQFSDRSHGFRKRRGCHTALREIQRTWTGTVWFIEADISDCFGSLDHDVMVRILAEKIRDNRFLRLRRINPQYRRLNDQRQRARKRGNRASARELLRQMRAVPCGDPMDPGYRRLRYCRYADDQLLGFTGPKAEAEQVKSQLAAFLRDELALELSAGKTLITHARDDAARFLGYEITVRHDNSKITGGRRMLNGTIALRVPLEVVRAKCAPYRRRGQPWLRPALVNLSDYDIVRVYGAEYRGVAGYYLLAGDAWRLHALRWHAETSMLKTLAAKHKSSVTKMAARYKAKIETPYGLRTCFEARVPRDGKKDLVARFGGIPLLRNENGFIVDPVPVPVPTPRKELIHRLRMSRCELCERHGTVAVHQVTKLARLGRPGPGQPAWAAVMASKRRKTLVVCQPCHQAIHATPVTNAA